MQASGNPPAPIVLTLSKRKSKEFMLIPLHEIVLIDVCQVTLKNTTTSKRERQALRMLVLMTQANEEENQ
jgi:hypothetical protein